MSRSVRYTFLGGLTLGAALAYFLDPLQGRRRREAASERTIRGWRTARDLASRTSADVARSTRGVRCRVRSLIGDPSAADDLLAHRVRSRMERILSHPGAIEVTAGEGRVTLRGEVRRWEIGPALAEAGRVRGVQGVLNHLVVVEEDAASRPGDTTRPAGHPHRWAPATRLLVAAAGAGAFARGRRRGGLSGLLWKSAGLAALTRSVSNLDVHRLTGLGAVRSAFHYRRSIVIDAPIERVFALWSNVENIPIILSHVRHVTDLGGRRSLWAAQGPAGIVEWETIVTRFVPERALAWKSGAGAPIPTTGVVMLDALPDGRTRVQLDLAYLPGPGGLASAVGALFGADPRTALDEDLERIKTLLEQREAAVPTMMERDLGSPERQPPASTKH